MNHLFFLIICIIGSLKGKMSYHAYDDLLDWGLNNSLKIAEALEMRFTNENNKTYYAGEDIPEQSAIMVIPSDLILSVDNALELLNNKKLNKIYSEYQKTEFEVKAVFLPAIPEQSFLSYLMFLVTHYKKQYKKTKFYKYFHYLLDTFETNLDSHPIFFNKEQTEILKKSYSFVDTLLMTRQFTEEYNTLEHLNKKDNVYLDEYLRFRVLTLEKSINVENVSSIIPFIDMFETDPVDYNANLYYNKTSKEMYVYATKDIKKGDILYLKTSKISNIKRFALYANTFEKMNNYMDSYTIPMMINDLISDLDEKKQNYYSKEKIDLNKKDFYKDALEPYKKLSIDKKEDGSDLSAYNLFLKNLNMIRENLYSVTKTEIDEAFINFKDVRNMIRVFDSEKYFMDKKIDELKKIIQKIKKKEKNSEKINNDL